VWCILCCYKSTGSMDGTSKADTYKSIRQAADIFEKKDFYTAKMPINAVNTTLYQGL